LFIELPLWLCRRQSIAPREPRRLVASLPRFRSNVYTDRDAARCPNQQRIASLLCAGLAMFAGSPFGRSISFVNAGQEVEFIALCWMIGSSDIEVSSRRSEDLRAARKASAGRKPRRSTPTNI
jgi:hypothetical protein